MKNNFHVAVIDWMLVTFLCLVLASCGTGVRDVNSRGSGAGTGAPQPAQTSPNQHPIANIISTSAVSPVGSAITLDGRGSSDPESAMLTFSWSILSKPQLSVATIANPVSPSTSFVPDVVGTYAVQLTVDDGVTTSTSARVEIRAGTPVTGVIGTSSVWDKPNSPFVLTGRVMIPGGVVLSIEAGVEVVGENYDMQVQGTLAINGTANENVRISDLAIVPAGSITSNHLISIQGASISGGALYAPTGNAIYGNLVMTDSHLSNMRSYIYLWYPTSKNAIERNVFDGTGGISYGLSGTQVSLTIKNNSFLNWAGTAIENWAMYDSATADISLNSFLSTDRIAVRLPPGYMNASLSAANNYWGTTNDSIINLMIFDKNDDLTSSGNIVYMPILSAPDPATPY